MLRWEPRCPGGGQRGPSGCAGPRRGCLAGPAASAPAGRSIGSENVPSEHPRHGMQNLSPAPTPSAGQRGGEGPGTTWVSRHSPPSPTTSPRGRRDSYPDLRHSPSDRPLPASQVLPSWVGTAPSSRHPVKPEFPMCCPSSEGWVSPEHAPPPPPPRRGAGNFQRVSMQPRVCLPQIRGWRR